jgi:hypothetical protein
MEHDRKSRYQKRKQIAMKNLTKKRKMLLALPAVVIPFVTLLLWSVGVIGSSDANAQQSVVQKGLITEVPDAKLEDETLWNKMRAYESADADSSAHSELMQNDLRALDLSIQRNENTSSDSITRAAEEKLKQLEMLTTAPPQVPTKRRATAPIAQDEYEKKNERPTTKEKDPELEALNQMMEKIMDIQHPERVSDKIAAEKKQMMTSRKAAAGIGAVIAQDQSLVSGCVVKLRLTEDLMIDSVVIPKHSLVTGIAQLSGERLEVFVRSVRNGNVIMPVLLSVFDLDGLPGIYIPGTITREAAKESAASAVSQVSVLSVDPSIRAKAATTGINAVKNLFTKKARLVRVQVRSGYRVLLREPLN